MPWTRARPVQASKAPKIPSGAVMTRGRSNGKFWKGGGISKATIGR